MNELEEEVLEPVKTDIIEETPEFEEEDILMTDILKQKNPPQDLLILLPSLFMFSVLLFLQRKTKCY